MALTAIEVRNAPPGRYADGNGLYLLVRSTLDQATRFGSIEFDDVFAVVA